MKLQPTMIQIIKLIGGTAFWVAVATILAAHLAPLAGHMSEPCRCQPMIEKDR